MKTSFIIPFKNRKAFLEVLLERLPKYIRDGNSQLDYNIIVSEQTDESVFNKSLSSNIAIKYAIDVLNSDHIIVHDVDIIPVSNVDYTYRGFCLCWFTSAGGLNCLSSDLLKVNGYCNSYYGWGDEDVDVIKRLVFYGVETYEWKDFSLKEKPVLVNMEWSNSFDSVSASKEYWGNDWPRFLKPAENDLPDFTVDKRINWYSKKYIKLNKEKLDRYSSLSPEQRHKHYQISGINQINLDNLKDAVNNIDVIYLRYNTRDMGFTYNH